MAKMKKKAARRGRLPSALVELRHLPIVAFGNEALREAFRIWWRPSHDMGTDFQKLCGDDVWAPAVRTRRSVHYKRLRRATVVGGDLLELSKLDRPAYRSVRAPLRIKTKLGRRPDARKRTASPVNVRLVLDYPLSEPQEKVVTIDRRYPGEVFAMAHDFYREVYAEDAKSEKRGNRVGGGGPGVYGHSLGDLVFHGCQFRAYGKPLPKYRGPNIRSGPIEGEFRFLIDS